MVFKALFASQYNPFYGTRIIANLTTLSLFFLVAELRAINHSHLQPFISFKEAMKHVLDLVIIIDVELMTYDLVTCYSNSIEILTMMFNACFRNNDV